MNAVDALRRRVEAWDHPYRRLALLAVGAGAGGALGAVTVTVLAGPEWTEVILPGLGAGLGVNVGSRIEATLD